MEDTLELLSKDTGSDKSKGGDEAGDNCGVNCGDVRCTIESNGRELLQGVEVHD